MENRIIRVTGKGMLKVRPDTTRLTLTVSGTYPEYQKALKKSAESTEALKDALSPLSFSGSDLKTLNFRIDAEYESYRDKHNNYQQRFVGYKFIHVAKLEFLSDNELLRRVLFALGKCPSQPEIHISYTVKDPEAAKNELLSKAVADAKAKSAILAAASSVELADILSIDYSWGEINFEVHPMDEAVMMKECEFSRSVPTEYGIDIEPDDIEVSDTVTIVWQIK